MHYVIQPTTLANHSHYVDAYLQQLSAGDSAGVSSRDDYWENHVFGSQFYVLCADDKEVGLAAIHQNRLLTCFYLQPQHVHHAQPLFAAFREKYAVTQAYVLTHDELLLSLAIEAAQQKNYKPICLYWAIFVFVLPSSLVHGYSLLSLLTQAIFSIPIM